MSGKVRAVIRVDASVEVGMGHLMRCLSLADNLGGKGVAVCFLMREQAAAFTGLIESSGHQLYLLRNERCGVHPADPSPLAHAHWLPVPWEQDAAEAAEAIEQVGSFDWLIVDHYALDARWEQLLRPIVPHILAIDDIADRAHDSDILLDQNLSLEMDTRYRGLLPNACRPLLGPRYALLRPEFAKTRKQMGARTGTVHHILVCFGGSDPSNETGKALAAIQSLSASSLDIDAVIGISNPNSREVSAICRELPRATLHRGAGNVAELMARADISIGAGGVMCWERCCLGLPAIALDIAANQVGALKALVAAGAVNHLGSAADVRKEQIARSLEALLSSPSHVRAMSEAAFAVADGAGVDRVCQAMGI